MSTWLTMGDGVVLDLMKALQVALVRQGIYDLSIRRDSRLVKLAAEPVDDCSRQNEVVQIRSAHDVQIWQWSACLQIKTSQ